MDGLSPEEIGEKSKVEIILDELFDTSKGIEDWWQDLPNTERIKDLVKRRIGDNNQTIDNASEQKSSGELFMARERQHITFKN